MRIKTTPTKLKRKYNAVYRLREKLSDAGASIEKRTKIIYSNDAELLKIPEVKLLINEFGFVVQPELFTI